jgi:dihydrofolate synthase/folylpolyglutamate synthase
MLGRDDATNVADAVVAVVTNIGRDHHPGGAGWEQAVATAKAGIVRPDATLVLGPIGGGGRVEYGATGDRGRGSGANRPGGRRPERR